MTAAISVAKHEGAEAVVCASTGNTSASMAAYAAKAGLKPLVLVPEGKIAAGKMAQAILHGAQVIMVRGNFDDCLTIARALAWDYPVALVNSVNPVRLEGQKTAAFEIVDFLGDAPDYHLLPVGNAGNISAYWLGYTQYADLGLRDQDARSCAASRPRAPRRWSPASRSPTRRPRRPRSGSATPRRGSSPRRPATSPAAASPPSATTRSWPPSASSPRHDGVFVEPASAAGVAGLLARSSPRGSRTPARPSSSPSPVTGSRTPPPRSRASAPLVDTVVDADVERRRRGRRAGLRPASMATFVAGPVRVSRPRDLGQPRPRLRLARAWRSTCATSSRPRCSPPGSRSRSRAPAPTTYRATSRTSSCARCARRSRRWASSRPACGWRAATSIPHARGLGSSSAAIVGGRQPGPGPGRRRQPAARRRRVFRLAAGMEGHPDNVAPGLSTAAS